MLSDKLAILMTRHVTKEASGQEEKELLALLTTEPEQQFFIDLLSDYWHQHTSSGSLVSENADEHFRYIIERAQDPGVRAGNSFFYLNNNVSLLPKKSKI